MKTKKYCKVNGIRVTNYKHSEGNDELVAFIQDDNTLTLTAIGRNHQGHNVSQLDVADLSGKKLKKLIKTLKSLHKDMTKKRK